MTERDVNDFENEDWDFDAAVVQQPSPTARAVVSVPFERDEFERLAAYARQRGLTITNCIHDLVVQRVAEGQPEINPDNPNTVHDPLD